MIINELSELANLLDNLFDDWLQEVYAHALAHIWGTYPHLELENIYVPPDMVMSYLNNGDGSFKQLPKYIFAKKQ